MTDSSTRDARTLETAPGAPPTPASVSGAGGVVAELRPYLPRMALGAALVIVVDLWWGGLKRRRERERERKRRRRRGWF